MTRQYYETEKQAEKHLEANGYWETVYNKNNSRWGWCREDGKEADIRFNSYGIFIEYKGE